MNAALWIVEEFLRVVYSGGAGTGELVQTGTGELVQTGTGKLVQIHLIEFFEIYPENNCTHIGLLKGT
jgi:hypothetical protein